MRKSCEAVEIPVLSIVMTQTLGCLKVGQLQQKTERKERKKKINFIGFFFHFLAFRSIGKMSTSLIYLYSF